MSVRSKFRGCPWREGIYSGCMGLSRAQRRPLRWLGLGITIWWSPVFWDATTVEVGNDLHVSKSRHDLLVAQRGHCRSASIHLGTVTQETTTRKVWATKHRGEPMIWLFIIQRYYCRCMVMMMVINKPITIRAGPQHVDTPCSCCWTFATRIHTTLARQTYREHFCSPVHASFGLGR